MYNYSLQYVSCNRGRKKIILSSPGLPYNNPRSSLLSKVYTTDLCRVAWPDIIFVLLYSFFIFLFYFSFSLPDSNP